ncbi:carbohydrate ABC transporter permease [Kitasatospora viridis]|uniref:Carbohydrate ABC transporter membrane protein 1 (CUT1 family) n=1 Tax=Kitasatospora viridis TaxID=281105 RepID=A0A561SE04_9ACTN|nr:sugar ABC transporter permease [Kitasatospora viridis]TWF73103.1 carbohydrate ABC transporter membrane protein 1 (CUT1 family) [Kitasatospora viridis]
MALLSEHLRRRGRPREGWAGWLYTAPALLIFSVFTIGPTVYTLYISTFHWNTLNPSMSSFIGTDNYRQLFQSTSPDFMTSAVNSLYYCAAMVIGGTALSLGLALLLQRGGRVLNAGRVAVFAPHATPIVATSLAWVWLFNPQFGLIDMVLKQLDLPTPQFLFSSTWAMPSVIVYSLWHEIGITVVLFLGGLAVTSGELSEAARMDGAGAWKEFWYVTWPQLRPVTLFSIVITSISSLQAFTQFYEMSRGGPAYATTTLSYLLYQEAFVLFDTGYGAALAVVLFVVTAAFTLLQRRIGDKIAADL